MILKRCSNLCEIGLIAFPAFGAGMLLTLFLPPCALVGASALSLVVLGVLCLLCKR